LRLKKAIPFKAIIVVGNILLVSFYLFPIYAAFVGSLTPFERMGERLIFSIYLHYQNYVEVWFIRPLAKWLLNSCLYAFGVTGLVILLSTPAAYAMSRFRLIGVKYFLIIPIFFTQVVPQAIVVIPLFFLFQRLGLINTYLAPILASTVILIGFPLLFLREYFNTIPISLDEAALVDGCSRIEAFLRIILPSAAPALFSAMALTFTTMWQMFLIPLVLLIDEVKFPVTVAIFGLLGGQPKPWHLIMSMSIISIIPPLVFYFFAQKFIIQGLAGPVLK